MVENPGTGLTAKYLVIVLIDVHPYIYGNSNRSKGLDPSTWNNRHNYQACSQHPKRGHHVSLADHDICCLNPIFQLNILTISMVITHRDSYLDPPCGWNKCRFQLWLRFRASPLENAVMKNKRRGPWLSKNAVSQIESEPWFSNLCVASRWILFEWLICLWAQTSVATIS